MPATDEQKRIVQVTFRKLVPVSEKTVSAFYDRLFELDPPARKLFKGDMKEQMRKFIKMLAVIVSGLDRIDELASAMERLGKRHAHYGVAVEQFNTVGEALLWSVQTTLGADYTAEVQDAWQAVYKMLAEFAIRGGFETQ